MLRKIRLGLSTIYIDGYFTRCFSLTFYLLLPSPGLFLSPLSTFSLFHYAAQEARCTDSRPVTATHNSSAAAYQLGVCMLGAHSPKDREESSIK